MYAWGDHRRFNSYSGYFRRTFGGRVQKISVDAGFTCPNRDGKIGEGGCTFCNNGAFTPSYCIPAKSIGRQIAEGIEFHGRRYRAASRYLVYFQSFSNTYAPLERLRALYGEALAYPGVAGIVIGTRPDCVDAEKLDYLAEIARDRYVAVEFGIESTCDETLRAVNRGHDFACARRAVEMAAERGVARGGAFHPRAAGRDRRNAVGTGRNDQFTAAHDGEIPPAAGFPRHADGRPVRCRPPQVPFLGGRSVHRPVRRDTAAAEARPGRRTLCQRGAAPPYHYGRNWGLVRNEQLLAMLEKRLEERGAYQGEIFYTFVLESLIPVAMKPITMEQVLKTFKEYFLMTVGMMLYSFAWIGCIMPADGTGGGATGLSRVLCHAVEHWAGISIQIGTMAFLINGVLLLVAGFIIGWNFGVKTVFCVCVISLGLNFWQSVLPEGDFLHLERILSVILGGILAGIGIAMCFAQGGSTGGTDIVAMIINKYRTISYGKILIYSDFVIIGSSMLVGFHIDTVIYGYVMTAVVGYTVDMIMAGNQQSSQVFIVTHDYEKMAEAIVENIHRGVTLIDSQGWYTKKQSKIVMVVCRKRETAMILKFVKTIDPEAFMTVGSVMGVYGKGFQAISKP